MSWENKAKRVIGVLCKESYEQANKGRKRHVPYSVPETARDLTDCLNNGDEERAKAIMMYDYHASKVK